MGRKEMLRLERDSSSASFIEQADLALGGDQPSGAASFLRIPPPQNSGRAPTGHFGDDANASAYGDDCVRGLQHESHDMRLSHNVKHAIIALDADWRKSHDAPMRLSEVTPDWIARQRDALGLRDADIYRAIGMSQDKFSKSMRGKRAFTPAELDAIVNFLSGEQAAARVPVLAEIVARFPRLSREQQELVANVVDNLWRSAQEARQSDKEPPEDA